MMDVYPTAAHIFDRDEGGCCLYVVLKAFVQDGRVQKTLIGGARSLAFKHNHLDCFLVANVLFDMEGSDRDKALREIVGDTGDPSNRNSARDNDRT